MQFSTHTLFLMWTKSPDPDLKQSSLGQISGSERGAAMAGGLVGGAVLLVIVAIAMLAAIHWRKRHIEEKKQKLLLK